MTADRNWGFRPLGPPSPLLMTKSEVTLPALVLLTHYLADVPTSWTHPTLCSYGP